MAVSPARLSLDMTATCTSGVVLMSTQPPAVTSIPALSTATITSREIDVNTGSSDVDPVPRLGPVSASVGESVTAIELSSPPLSEQPAPVPVVESVPAVHSSFSPDQSSVQTVLASGTSSRPEVGSSAVAPPMDMEDSPLLATGLPGCPYRFTSYSGQPFADGNPAFGLQLHHPRFLESVGAPESARLLYRSPTFWVDQLGEEQAMAAAVNLQRDAGIMLSNIQILSQFATSLHHMSF